MVWGCLLVLVPPFLAERLEGLVSVLGGFPPILAGCLRVVPCFPWLRCGVNYVGWICWWLVSVGWWWRLGFVLLSLSVLGSGGWSALRGLLLAWRCLMARGGESLCGAGLPGGVQWVFPPLGSVAGCCVWCVAMVLRRLSLAWWAGFVGPGLSLFVCLLAEVAVGSVRFGVVWGGVPRVVRGACLVVPRVVGCGLSFWSGACRWCYEAGSCWSLLFLRCRSGGSACGCGAERSRGCACGCRILLPLARVGVGAGCVVAPGWGHVPVGLG